MKAYFDLKMARLCECALCLMVSFSVIMASPTMNYTIAELIKKAGETSGPVLNNQIAEPIKKADESTSAMNNQIVRAIKKADETTTSTSSAMNNQIMRAIKKADETTTSTSFLNYKATAFTTSASDECFEKTEVAETMLFMGERARLAFSLFTL